MFWTTGRQRKNPQVRLPQCRLRVELLEGRYVPATTLLFIGSIHLRWTR